MSNNFAHLKEDSPFHAFFENGMVPIKNVLLPNRVVCEGAGGGLQDVYFVDLDKLAPSQFEAVIEMVRAQCDPSIPLEQCRAEILERGLPLRAKHVRSISSDSRHFL